jgi:uncharacterized protein (DUF433 family)
MMFEPITIDPEVLGSVSGIRGPRASGAVVGMLAGGMIVGDILADFTYRAADDVTESLRFRPG